MFRRIEIIGRYDPDDIADLLRFMEEWPESDSEIEEIRHTPLDYKCGLAGNDLFGGFRIDGLCAMNAPRRRIHKNCRFYFTEEGWRRYGRQAVAICQREGLRYRVIAIKERSVDLVYRDEVQVAVRPRKRKDAANADGGRDYGLTHL